MKMPRYLLLPITGLAVLAAACSEKETASTSDATTLAEVGSQAVTESDFRHAWDKRPPRKDSDETRGELLDHLIRRTALAEAARQAGLEDDPVVREQFENLLIGRLRETQLNPKLAAVSVTDDEVRSRFEQQEGARPGIPRKDRVAVLWFDSRGQQPLVDRYRPRLEQVRSQLESTPDLVP